jgi:hypothetical protein
MVLDQYIGVAMANLAFRMNEEMITHTPSTRPANCRPGNPRGLASAKAPIPAAASPAIASATLALAPPCCSVRNTGEQGDPQPGQQAERGGCLRGDAAPVGRQPILGRGPPGVGGQQGGQDPHQGGLTRPVRAEQALHGPRRDAHVHAGQRPGLPEGLADALHLDHGATDPADQCVRDLPGLASFTFDEAQPTAHAPLTRHAVTYRIGAAQGPPRVPRSRRAGTAGRR